MCGNTMAFSEARGAAIVTIHHDSFPDRLFFIILIQRKKPSIYRTSIKLDTDN